MTKETSINAQPVMKWQKDLNSMIGKGFMDCNKSCKCRCMGDLENRSKMTTNILHKEIFQYIFCK